MRCQHPISLLRGGQWVCAWEQPEVHPCSSLHYFSLGKMPIIHNYSLHIPRDQLDWCLPCFFFAPLPSPIITRTCCIFAFGSSNVSPLTNADDDIDQARLVEKATNGPLKARCRDQHLTAKSLLINIRSSYLSTASLPSSAVQPPRSLCSDIRLHVQACTLQLGLFKLRSKWKDVRVD